MKDDNFIDALFFDPDLQLIDLKKGLTNKNYLMKTQGQEYVLRIPREDSAHIVDRHHEHLALDALSSCDIDVETIYYDEASGYKVTRYMQDAQAFAQCPFPDKIERVARLMKQFHGLRKSIGEEFDPIARMRQYQRHIQTCPFVFTGLEHILQELQVLQQPHVLCHNDWVSGNILFTKERTYLIDYEYAADNDPLFDVISFLSENNLSLEERERFYAVYFDEMHDELREKLMIWEAFEDALWCFWAIMMWESRHEAIYQAIAKEKHEGYQKIMKQYTAHRLS